MRPHTYNVPETQYARLFWHWQLACLLLGVCIVIIAILGALAIEMRMELSDANRLLATCGQRVGF